VTDFGVRNQKVRSQMFQFLARRPWRAFTIGIQCEYRISVFFSPLPLKNHHSPLRILYSSTPAFPQCNLHPSFNTRGIGDDQTKRSNAVEHQQSSSSFVLDFERPVQSGARFSSGCLASSGFSPHRPSSLVLGWGWDDAKHRQIAGLLSSRPSGTQVLRQRVKR
jgi:hypothetical protein